MKQIDDLDRQLSAWLDEPYNPPAPRYLAEVLERTRRTRQRPAWASLERWLPMALTTPHPAAAQPLRLAWIVLVALLMLGLLAGVAVVGSRLLTPAVAIPQGGAAVFAFGSLVGDQTGQTGGDIFTVRADGTDLRQLTSGPANESIATWSPDGTRIAYRHWESGHDSVAVMDAAGGSRATLFTTDQPTQYCTERWNLAWSPDGTSLIFPTSLNCGGPQDLFIVAADGSSPATPLLGPGLNSYYAAWSPDGTQVAFVGTQAGTSGLYVVDAGAGSALAGGLQARRIGPDLGSAGAPFSGPQWSPDGTQLAVAAVAVNWVAAGVFVLPADGSGTPLAIEDAASPAWSPDGRQLAFHRTVDPSEYWDGRPCTARTWIVDVDGSDERRLENLGDYCDFPPLWSPDGTRLASILIDTTPDTNTAVPFHLSIVTVDGSSPVVTLPDATLGSWQPVAAPLPPAPSFSAASPTP